jgi:hypothetical protein
VRNLSYLAVKPVQLCDCATSSMSVVVKSLAFLAAVPLVSTFAPVRFNWNDAAPMQRAVALGAKAIIWDCDGVLVDSEALLKQVPMLFFQLC